ncbi:MAG: hypothetical protein U0M06_06920 [Clostridia bacterium]|nr:hypothetical protein [Clostridia bacterium]
MKNRVKSLLIIFFILALSSCSGKIIENKTADYSGETVIGSASGDTEVISELSDIIYALTIDSLKLPEFSDMNTAIEKCSDSLLNHLLTTNYSRFSGSTEVLRKAAEEYPQMSISAAIGSGDFEGALYKYFGHGGNIRHSDTARFRYLSKISAYIPAVREQANSFSLDIRSIEETQSTYRMSFYLTEGDEVSPEYYAVFVKRENSGSYIQSLKKAGDEKIIFDLPKSFS